MRAVLERTDKLAVGFSRAVTRRTFLQRAGRTALGVGVATFAPLTIFQGRAEGAVCGPGGVVGSWGCSCAPTLTCPTGTCSNGNCSGIRKRCTYWTTPNSQGNYCWCSLTCCNACNGKGYHTCCDCWNGGGTKGCGIADNQAKCVCKTYVHVGCCSGGTCCQ